MHWQDIEAARYYLSLGLWLTLPAAILFWLVVHPLAPFWRRLGPTPTYIAMFLFMGGVGTVCWLWREPVMATSYPVRPGFVVLGLALYALAVVIEVRCRKHLKMKILMGVPELSASDPGRLLTEGIYAHTRNPRYLDLMIGMLGWSLILNFQVMYWLTVTCVPCFYVVTRLEERELRQRFGKPYEEYLERVPRFLPRSWSFLRA
jgi:protein-S-isoprenylcysteine O-methyltransferase Ste14